MDFNLKNYKTIKTKIHFIKPKLLILFNSSKSDFKNWTEVEKKLIGLKFEFYQIHNKTAIKLLTNSIFQNSINLISSLTVFTNPKYNSTKLKIKNIEKHLKPLFIFLFIKLNNKIYYNSQIKTLDIFSYNKTIKNFYTQINQSIKYVYKY
jgi:hypothetical protein